MSVDKIPPIQSEMALFGPRAMSDVSRDAHQTGYQLKQHGALVPARGSRSLAPQRVKIGPIRTLVIICVGGREGP
jgi:hypothetical protein